MPPDFLARQMERLLTHWANLPGTLSRLRDAKRSLLHHYPEIFDGLDPETTDDMILSVQNHLRAAWDSPDARSRDWFIFKARLNYKKHLEIQRASSSPIGNDLGQFIPKGALFNLEQLQIWGKLLETEPYIWMAPPEKPPAQTQFEQVMSHFQRIGNKAAHCKYSECPWPYFFRKRNNQQYCHQKCAAAAQREAKRRWWHENKNRVRRKSK